MASNPPGICCFTGFKHEGNPAGNTQVINGINTYVATPKGNQKPTKAVLLISDVFGVVQNSKLLADDFASSGYYCFLPDLFEGEFLPLDVFEKGNFDIPAWASRHGPEQIDPILNVIIEHIRKVIGVDKVAGAGYCFGGKYVARFLQDGKLDVGYTAHPSYMSFDELQSIKKPLSITAAEIDTIFTQDLRHKSEEILSTIGLPYQINLYSGVAHGFAVRGDLTIPHNKFCKEQAFIQALEWFGRHI